MRARSTSRARLPGAWSTLVVCGLLVAQPGAFAQDEGLSFDGLVKAGVEADTNPERITGDGSETDVVERLFAELALTSREARQVVSGLVRVGAKRFHEHSDEDAVVFDVNGAFRRLLLGDVGVFARLNARNRSERGHLRDYVRLTAQTGLYWRPQPFSFSAAPTVSYFLYRPDDELSHIGVGVYGQIAWRPSDLIGLSTTYLYTRRRYAQEQVVADDTVGLTLAEGSERIDRTHLAGLSFTLETVVLGQLELLWQRNTSNSFGKAYSRITGRLSLTAPLPLNLYATGQVSIQRTLFDDNVLIDPTVAIDEENRNAFVLSLSGDIVDWLRWETRYSLYLQEFGGDDESYTRHLVYGGLIAVIGE